MNEAVDFPLMNHRFLLKDLSAKPRIHWGISDVYAALNQVPPHRTSHCPSSNCLKATSAVSQSLLCWTAGVSLDLYLHSSGPHVELISRKWMYISVRVWGISALRSSSRSFWSTVDEIQQKTGMWHMMWRLLALLMCEMIRWLDAGPWFSSWNIPPSEAQWIPEFLSDGWCIWRGSDWLLLVWRWSRWEQREAALLSWGLTSTQPLMKSQSHHKLSEYLKTSVWFYFHPDHQRWTQLYTPHKSLSLDLEVQDESPAEVCEDCTDDLGSSSALEMKAQTWNLHPDWLFPRPSPELTSAQRRFFRFQRCL